MLDETLFQYLQKGYEIGRNEFRLSIQSINDDHVVFLIHPLSQDGVTMNVLIEKDGNTIEATDLTCDNAAWSKYQAA